MKKYKQSRFNIISYTEQNNLIIYNSYTGAIATFSKEEEEEAQRILKLGVDKLSNLGESLLENGFIVSEEIDEKNRALFFHQSLHRTDLLHLSILPTEECNFRCTYCYETFPRGKMSQKVIEGIKNFVWQKAPTLRDFSVSWFGGEPLLAIDVIEDLSDSFLITAKQYNINYSAEIATNGFYLNEENFWKLLNAKINRIMVTIDGPEDIHDMRRHLRNNGKTFSRILSNLQKIKKINADYEIHIRVNFDNDNLNSINELIQILSDNFANDNRFQVYFRPVGRWGGPNNENIPVCEPEVANENLWRFFQYSINQGLKMSNLVENILTPGGAVCYAAKPFAFVINAHGKLHKCTLDFENPLNNLGEIREDGSAKIDYDKLAFWVTSGEEKDEVCQNCFFRPACQGNHCPYYRLQTGKQPCSYEKQKIKTVLNLIWQNSLI